MINIINTFQILNKLLQIDFKAIINKKKKWFKFCKEIFLYLNNNRYLKKSL